MDVIGNNIANVNTTAFKSKSINFADMLYQTTQSASAPNPDSGTAGTNARQIGLGVKTAAISTSITSEGSTQTTGNPFDLKLTGEAFFIVNDGSNTYFTRDGSFQVDAAGYLAMSGTGYNVMGWTNVDQTTGQVTQGNVSKIKVLDASTQTYEPAATTRAYFSGILDKYDKDLEKASGEQIALQIYDKLGYSYNLKFGILPVENTTTSTKNATVTERIYDLPAAVKIVDNSTVTYSAAIVSGGTTTLNSTNVPDALLDAIRDAATSATAITGTTKYNTYGTAGSATVTLNDDFFAVYGASDELLDNRSDLYGATVTVNFSGDLAVEGFSDPAATDTSSLGLINMDYNTLRQIYTDLPATLSYDNTTPANNLKVLNAGGGADTISLLVTEKAYSDGTASTYTYQLNTVTAAGASTNGAELDLQDAEMQKLMAKDASPEVVAQYTTTEDVNTTEIQDGQYTIKLQSLTDSDGKEIALPAGMATEFNLVYNTADGTFNYVGTAGSDTFTLNLSTISNNFENLVIDASTSKNVDNEGNSTIGATKGDLEGNNAGRKIGELTGVSISTDGMIYATYSNSQTRLLGQIAVATFANANGLANVGDNCYETTQNSGDFNGVGVDIKASGTGYMTSGCLEMSNVDLSNEFTEMITTQRGFQANSRIITVSDTLLEELTNLKR